MIILKDCIKKFITFFFLSYFMFFSSVPILSAKDINWIKVANTNNEIQFIDADSIKYNSSGFLSFITKYYEINPEDQKTINTNTYLLAVDCENRLFRKLPVNAELKKVKNWERPINDKLIKKTILNSCSF